MKKTLHLSQVRSAPNIINQQQYLAPNKFLA